MYGSPRFSRMVPLLALVLLGVVLPPFVPQYFLYIGNTLMMYAVLAIGLDLLIGWAGQFAFAHIAFFGVGAYATVLMPFSKLRNSIMPEIKARFDAEGIEIPYPHITLARGLASETVPR